jgi:sulfatase maturation enzyme AslB (radical SAM superfamily)
MPGVDKKQHQAYKWLKQGAWPRNQDTNFWNNLRELLPNIKYIEFTGGEPWLIKEHFDLLEHAVALGHSKHIDIHYNTNGTVMPDRLWLWQHFGRVDIAFSIDNVQERFEYERYGAVWDEVVENIDTIHRIRDTWQGSIHNSNITTQLCFTVNIQNVYYLDELLAWADTKGFNNIYFNMLHSPDHVSVQRMTPQAQELVLNKLKTVFWTSAFYQKEIDSVINFIELGSGSDGAEFLEKMQRTDAYRKENFALTHPEIARAMGYE